MQQIKLNHCGSKQPNSAWVTCYDGCDALCSIVFYVRAFTWTKIWTKTALNNICNNILSSNKEVLLGPESELVF